MLKTIRPPLCAFLIQKKMINKGVLKVGFIFTFFKTSFSSDKNEFTKTPFKNEEKVTYEDENKFRINGNDYFLYKPKKSKDILFSNKKNRLIFEERRHLVKEEKICFVATENLLTNEETSREESNTDIHREPVVIVSF